VKNIVRLWLLLAVFAMPVSWAASPKYDTFYVFGDSLSDTGNDIILTKAQKIFPAIPPSESPHRTYYNGRFSNGPVSVEYLWRLLKGSNSAVLAPFLSKQGLQLQDGINLAFGGSTSGYVNQTPGGFYVPGALGQVELFRTALKGKKPQPGALYVIWTGANDYITGATDQPAEVVANIAKTIETLYSLGARNFLVPNLPDLGLAPIIQSEGPEKIQEFSQFTETHNDLLDRAGNELKIKLRGSSIVIVDLYTVSQNLLSNGIPPTSEHIIIAPPALAVIAAGTEAVSCLFTDPTACPDVNVTETVPPFYFWDILHPTTLIHQLLGQAMFNSLKTHDSQQNPTSP